MKAVAQEVWKNSQHTKDIKKDLKSIGGREFWSIPKRKELKVNWLLKDRFSALDIVLALVLVKIIWILTEHVSVDFH